MRKPWWFNWAEMAKHARRRKAWCDAQAWYMRTQKWVLAEALADLIQAKKLGDKNRDAEALEVWLEDAQRATERAERFTRAKKRAPMVGQ